MIDFMLNGLIVLMIAVCTDIIWTYCVKSVSKGDRFKASFSSALIIIAGGYITVEYVNDQRLLLFAGVGGFIGTYITMTFMKGEE